MVPTHIPHNSESAFFLGHPVCTEEKKQKEMKKGGDGELGNFGRANIKSPAGAASQLLRIPADFDQTQDQR